MHNPTIDPTAEVEAAHAFIRLRDITIGYWLSRCLHVVANLGVADALGDAADTVESLAHAVGADPRALSRVLRLVSAHGIFDVRDDRVAHTPASRLLREDHPRSARPFVRMLGFPVVWDAFGNLEHAVRTGRPGFEKVDPGGFFTYLADHPEEARIFAGAMRAGAQETIAGVLQAYDFSTFRTIADIGGGRGHLLRAILGQAPHATGVLFDLPHVVADVAADPPDRVTLEGGNFFEDRLPVSDAYVLMHVLHDWTDEEATALLANVRRAATPGATLLVVENVIGAGGDAEWSRMLDINMLANTGGRERTRQEFDQLFRATGFRLDRILPAGSGAIVEASAI